MTKKEEKEYKTEEITEYANDRTMKYKVYPSGYQGIIEVNGFRISEDKCAYACKFCNALFQSKNIYCRSIFPTDDPRSKRRCVNPEGHDLERVCKCEPIIQG